MQNIASPLRYPGGKRVLTDFLSQVIKINNMSDPVYAEPYAGGAGAALALLFSEKVSHIVLNDKDRCIFALWKAMLNQTTQFLDLLESTPITIDEWRLQREIYLNPSRHGQLRLGFATFFLNRCNRSGILVNGGPIGGFEQQGKWTIDARFNRSTLQKRIEKIQLYRERIEIYNLDALDFLRKTVRPIAKNNQCLVYLDPPYYTKGQHLYLNAYDYSDHAELARFLKRTSFFKWILTYDNVPQIYEMYANYAPKPFELGYSASQRKAGYELLINDPRLILPADFPDKFCATQS